jgi:pimeloyl-ACP methyl ester carboxylesterase
MNSVILGKTLLYVAIGLLIIYVGLALFLYLSQHRLLYYPDFPTRELANTPHDIGLTYEDVQLLTEDSVMLHAWFIPGETRITVLFFHGNAGNISHRLGTIRLLHELGMNVFIVDYRGYGASEGAVTEQGTYRDAEAAWLYVTENRGIKSEHIVIFGRSLGGAIATWLAEKHTPGALIVESCFTSIPDVAAKQYPYFPVRLLSRFQYCAAEDIANVRCPILIVHSHEDELVPYEHGLHLYQKAHEPKVLLELTGTHNEQSLQCESEYAEGIRQFVSRFFFTPFNKTL